MKRTGLIIIALVTVLVVSVISLFWLLIGNPLNPVLAEYRLQSTLQSLPQIPGSVVVKYWKGTSGGAQEGCGALSVEELIGTSDLFFPEVLDYYASALPARGWKLDLANIRGRSFHHGDELDLAVSDSYDFSHVGGVAASEARIKFRTIFLLELGTPLNVSNYKKCRGQ